jgi:hypothetical protein
MTIQIKEILESKTKPKEKQKILVETVLSRTIPIEEFIEYFISASDKDKGNCADAMKHISAENPEILAPYIETIIDYINYKAPRVKWGIPESIGNMAQLYPAETAKAIPFLLKNTSNDNNNTTVIKWCAAFALTNIAINNSEAANDLIPIFQEFIRTESNIGVRNVYVKALKEIDKRKKGTSSPPK